MQSAMNRLSVFVRGHRKLVFAGWIVLLLISIPFASRQTENPTGGGFEVRGAGSGSDNDDRQMAGCPGQNSEPLGVVVQRKGGDRGRLAAAVVRVDAAA